MGELWQLLVISAALHVNTAWRMQHVVTCKLVWCHLSIRFDIRKGKIFTQSGHLHQTEAREALINVQAALRALMVAGW